MNDKQIHRQYDFKLPMPNRKVAIFVPKDKILCSKFTTGNKPAYGEIEFKQQPAFHKFKVWISEKEAGEPITTSRPAEKFNISSLFSFKWSQGVSQQSSIELEPDTEYYLNLECLDEKNAKLIRTLK